MSGDAAASFVASSRLALCYAFTFEPDHQSIEHVSYAGPNWVLAQDDTFQMLVNACTGKVWRND